MTMEEKQAQSTKKDPNFLHQTIDAQVWAKEFCRIFPDADEGNMIGWFANAMMTAFDEGASREREKIMGIEQQKKEAR